MSSQTNKHTNYLNGMLNRSKKISKIAAEPSEPIEKQAKPEIFTPILKDFSSFTNEESHEFQKIKERTMKMLILKPSLLRKSVESLLFYSQKAFYQDSPKSVEIELEVIFNKALARVPIKCFRVPLPSYSLKNKEKILFIVKSEAKFGEKTQKIKDFEKDFKIYEFNGKKGLFHEETPANKRKKIKEIKQIFCEDCIYNELMKKEGRFLYSVKRVPYVFASEQAINFSFLYSNSYLFIREKTKQVLTIGDSSNSVQEICNNTINGAIYAVSLLLKYSTKHTHVQEINLKCMDSLPLTIWKNSANSF